VVYQSTVYETASDYLRIFTIGFRTVTLRDLFHAWKEESRFLLGRISCRWTVRQTNVQTWIRNDGNNLRYSYFT